MREHTVYLCSLSFLGLDSDLSLYLLLMLCLFWVAATRNMKFSWGWHVPARAALIATFAILGLTIGPRWLYACLGWLSFIILYVLPIILFKQFINAQVESNAKKLIYTTNCLRFFIWGKQGQYSYDIAKAMSLYINNDKESAEKLLNKWLLQKPPNAIQNQIEEFRLGGYLSCQAWPQIIEKYQSRLLTGAAISNSLNLYASRAYSECGQFREAISCLNNIEYPKSANNVYGLMVPLFTFYCSIGASENVEQLLKLMSDYKYDLPNYIKNYWLGRLAMVNNDTNGAKNFFDAAMKDAQNFPVWQKRIDDKRKQIPESVPDNQEYVRLIEPAWKNLKNSMSSQEIIRPRKQYKTVTVIIASIMLVFFLANSYSLLPNQLTYLIEMFCYREGILVPASVLSGEYWRLFTFLFLHAHLVHAAVNVIALFWLGKMAEKIYGMKSFLLIYFLSGILSGVVSVAFSPDLAAIGASGAIMGIFGAVGAGIFRLKDFLPASIRRKQLKLMIGLLVFQLIIDQIIPHIDAWAHLGGLITGIVLGLLLPIGTTSIDNSKVQLA